MRGVFGPLVDEDHHEVDVRVGSGDALGHLGEEFQALDPRIRRHQHPLAQRQGGEDVNDLLGIALRSQPEERLRIHRGERIELRPLIGLRRGRVVHSLRSDERVELLPAARLPLSGLLHRAGHRIPTAKPVPANHSEVDVDIGGAGEVARGSHEGVVVQDVQHARDGNEDIAVSDVHLFIRLALTRVGATLAVSAIAASASARCCLGVFFLGVGS